MKRLIILIIILLVPFTSAYNTTFVEEYIDKLATKVNTRPLYSQFLTDSKYNSLNLNVEGHDYYVVFDRNISRVPYVDATFTVKMSYEQFVTVARAHSAGDGKTINKIAMKVAPFKVKFSLLIQCIRTTWCRKAMV